MKKKSGCYISLKKRKRNVKDDMYLFCDFYVTILVEINVTFKVFIYEELFFFHETQYPEP